MTGLGKRFDWLFPKKWLIVPQPVVQTLLGLTPADFVQRSQYKCESYSEAPVSIVVLLAR